MKYFSQMVCIEAHAETEEIARKAIAAAVKDAAIASSVINDVWMCGDMQLEAHPRQSSAETAQPSTVWQSGRI